VLRAATRVREHASRATISRLHTAAVSSAPARRLLHQGADPFPASSVPARTPFAPDATFCNRELRLDQVEVMGFDYDFTLASYKHTLQSLIYDRAKQYLLERLNYPEALSSRSYDRNFAIRGLVFDQRRGVLLKLSYSQAISPDTAFLGRRRLSADELRELYGEALHLDASYVTEHTKPLNDLFSLSEACLLADVVQLAVDLDIPFDPAALGEDVSRAIAWVHISGTMHDEARAPTSRQQPPAHHATAHPPTPPPPILPYRHHPSCHIATTHPPSPPSMPHPPHRWAPTQRPTCTRARIWATCCAVHALRANRSSC
jgi:hypothetical protein